MSNTVRRPDAIPGQTPGSIIIAGKEYFRLKTAAQVLGVEEKWLYRRIWNGKGPPHKRPGGGPYFLPVIEFYKWFEQDSPA